jgi:hypothetical protein
MRGRPATIVLVCLAAAWPALGQRLALLSGRILDSSDAGIPEAAISLINEDNGFRRALQSQPDGTYSITSLQPGLYSLLVRKQGFRSVFRFGIRLEAAHPASLNVTLPVGSMTDTITVSGTPDPIDSTDATVTTLVPHSQIERLPLNGRGPLGLIELAPGTIATPATRGEPGQFTSNGQRPNSNYFMVDGVSANNGVAAGGLAAQNTGGSLPAMSAFGSMDALISTEAIDELTVRTSTTAADFGRLPGAAISMTSRSGSSDFHGSAIYRFRHEALAANDWFANRAGDARAPLRLHKISPTLGGPILPKRTFFFLTYETLRLRQPYAWRSPVPSLAARAAAAEWVQPILNLFPVPNGASLGKGLAEWTGRNGRPASLQSGSLRLDHALTSRVTLFGRYQNAPSANEFGNTEINRLDLRTRTLTFGADVRPRPNLVFDLRLNTSLASARSFWQVLGTGSCALDEIVSTFLHNTGPCDDFVRFSISGVGQIAAGSEGDRRQTQYQVVQSAMWTRGSHAFRAGADYRRLAPRRRDTSGTLSIIAEHLSDLTTSDNLWQSSSDPVRASLAVRELSLWAHDTWQATPRLTISAGLRWELSPPPVPENAFFLDELSDTVVSSSTRPLWERSYRNFAPRIGGAWRLNGRTAFRAGGGLYYDSSLSIATDAINGGPLSLGRHSSASHAPFSSLLTYGFRPDLTLPRITQWSAFVDRTIDAHDTLSLGYAGSAGRRLLRREMGGPGSTQTTWTALATNHGSSGYNGLQAQFRRTFSSRIQGLVSYTWAHALDDSSSDSLLQWAGTGSPASRDHASSDFDLRHSLTAAFTGDLGRGWSVDGVVRTRTGFPIGVIDSEEYIGIPFANAFRPNRIEGVSLWKGNRLNAAAFRPTTGTVQGNLGRNAIAGFGMSQLDVAVRREFPLGGHAHVQLRLDAFNALNRASLSDPVRFLDSPLFGQSASMLNLMLGTGSPGSGLAPIFQNGGPRSIEVSVRFRF